MTSDQVWERSCQGILIARYTIFRTFSVGSGYWPPHVDSTRFSYHNLQGVFIRMTRSFLIKFPMPHTSHPCERMLPRVVNNWNDVGWFDIYRHALSLHLYLVLIILLLSTWFLDKISRFNVLCLRVFYVQKIPCFCCFLKSGKICMALPVSQPMIRLQRI